MATPVGAAALVTALRREGLTVVEVGDWRRHHRNHKGPWGPVHGVMVHHTATSGSARTVEICRDGYTGLPGPLCHGVITKDGRVHLVGHGRANHAGLGDDDVLRAVIAERELPPDNEATVDGNRHFYGFECENLGDNRDVWPRRQYVAMVRATAALCRHHGWNQRSVIGHLEWQPGKPDPRGPLEGGGAFSMNNFRRDLAACLALPAGRWPAAPEEESNVQLNDEVKIAKWVMNDWPDDKGLQDGSVLVRTALGSGYGYARRAAVASRAALAQLGAMQATIDKLVETIGAGGGLTAAEIRAAAEAVAQAALDRLGQALTDGDES